MHIFTLRRPAPESPDAPSTAACPSAKATARDRQIAHERGTRLASRKQDGHNKGRAPVSHKIAVQRTIRAWPVSALAVVLAAGLLGACSSSAPAAKSGSSRPTTSTGTVEVASLHAMLPSAIK